MRFGDDDGPPDADGEDWGLTVSDEDDRADMPPEAERTWSEPETVGAVSALFGAASNAEFEWAMLPAPVAGEQVARRRATDPDKLLWQYVRWTSKGLLVWVLFAGGFLVGLQLFRASPVAPRLARQGLKPVTATPQMTRGKAGNILNDQAAAGDPDRAVLVRQPVRIDDARQRDEPVKKTPNALPPVRRPAPAARGAMEWRVILPDPPDPQDESPLQWWARQQVNQAYQRNPQAFHQMARRNQEIMRQHILRMQRQVIQHDQAILQQQQRRLWGIP